MKSKPTSDSGFTFVETLVAVGLVGILIGASFGIGSRILAALHERTMRLQFWVEAAQLADYLERKTELARWDAESRRGSEETDNSLWNPPEPEPAEDLPSSIPLSIFPSLQVQVDAGGSLLLTSRVDPDQSMLLRPPRLNNASSGTAPAASPVVLGTLE